MQNPPLPEWAKVLSGPLPKTTAKMLELDYLHREKNPLGPVLAARIRGVVADALGSTYGDQTALADLRRAGLGDQELFKGVNVLATGARRLRLRQETHRGRARDHRHGVRRTPQALRPREGHRDRPHRRLRQLPQPHPARARRQGRVARPAGAGGEVRLRRLRRRPPRPARRGTTEDDDGRGAARPRRVERSTTSTNSTARSNSRRSASSACRCRTSRASRISPAARSSRPTKIVWMTVSIGLSARDDAGLVRVPRTPSTRRRRSTASSPTRSSGW